MKNKLLLCLVITLVTFAGTLLVGYFEIGQFVWISFLALQFYFLKQATMRLDICRQLFASFFVGLMWGLLSAWLWEGFYGILPFWALNLLDNGLLVLFLTVGALIVFSNSWPNDLPTTFSGLTIAILLWGRPLPFVGQGLLGQRSVIEGVLIACVMYLFGLVLAYLMDFIYFELLKHEKPIFTGPQEDVE